MFNGYNDGYMGEGYYEEDLDRQYLEIMEGKDGLEDADGQGASKSDTRIHARNIRQKIS